MRQPSKITYAGDWHQNTTWAMRCVWAARKAGSDTIVHTGDYGYTFHGSFVDSVERECDKSQVMIYFVDGNHDLHEMLWALPLDDDGFGFLSDHVRYIPRGHRWVWWDQTFMGLGGATSVDKDMRKPFVEWWPTESLTTADVYKATYGEDYVEHMAGLEMVTPKPVDVMIAHDAPSGVPIPGISFEEGSKFFPAHALREADAHRAIMREVVDAVKPKLFVHGHYHRMYSYVEGVTKYVGLDCDGSRDGGNLWIVG